MPTVVVDGVVIAAWVQVAILAVLTMAALGGLRWGRRRVSRRRWRRDLGTGLRATADAVERVASAALVASAASTGPAGPAVLPRGPEPCAEPSSGESGPSR